jgi:hypothetical protein
MNQQKMLVVIVFFLFCTSCAGVKIYSDPEWQHPSALKFYYSKPFLLVEYNANKDGTNKTTIVYLPDLTEPYYAKKISGLGSSELKIAYDNGAIASFGLSTDTKIPESVAGLRGLAATVNQFPLLASDAMVLKSSQEKPFDLYAILFSDGKLVLKKVTDSN